MAFEPLVWFCRPVADGVWKRSVSNAFGAYTPCATDSLVVTLSHLVLLGLCVYRIWLIKRDFKAQRFCLRSKYYNYMLGLLALYATAEPLFRLIMGISVLNLDGQSGLSPFEIVSLVVEALTWCSIFVMIGVETKVYIREFRWFVRFGLLYTLIGDAVMLDLILSVREFYDSSILYLYLSEVLVQGLFGILLLVYLPDLDPYPGYTPMRTEFVDDAGYEELPGGEEICPERHVNIFSKIFFSWMSPLMEQGYKKPITEKDVWKLDTWDRTETLNNKFQKCWAEESRRPKPWLLRALNSSLGGRFWWGGFWKIFNDLSQFVGPLILNLLLQSMQQGDPAWIGYIYAFSIFVGVALGVLCEAQYFQNVMRVGFRLRSTLVAAVFRKSLRLTHEGRKKFASGKITNLMTTDAEALQQICQSLHTLWSAPFRIIFAMVLLYQQLGVASLLGALMLVLMFPVQTVVISRMQKLSKEGLQRTDKRIGLMNEVLAAMDTVKCYAWENSFQSKVQNVRDDELSWFRKASLLGACNGFILNSIPVVVTVISFGLFTLLGGDLTPARAFTSLSLFSVLRFPLFMLPNVITQVVNANVSLKRLEELFLTEERVLLPNPPLDPELPAIQIRDGFFSWDSKAERPTLSNINLDIPVGSLVAVVGSTGEGKTSLISAMLGELPPISEASVVIRGKVAYVPQVSWIFNATVRDNILFGSSFESARYEKALDVTALRHDLELLPGGDLTEIGERGVNISGGQKQRVSMARAVYSNSDVYIFDDPLSALDAHVARQVFDKCVKGELRGKTRVLVTNQLHFLSQVDRIILVHEGMVKEEGTFENLSNNGVLFQKLMENAGKMEEYAEENENSDIIDQKDSKPVANGVPNDMPKSASQSNKTKEGKSVLIKQEERETGVVSWNVLVRYKNALGGLWVVIVLFTCYILTEILRVSSSTWLSSWTDQSTTKIHGPGYYNLIYSLLSFGQVLVTLVNSYWLIISSLYAARRLHDAMLTSILRAPMTFFHTNPLGRIINRFAKDLGDIDRNVAPFVNMFLGQVSQLLSTFVLIGVVSTMSLWSIMPLLVLFYAAYLYYQSTAREVKRLDSVTRSPVYAQFGEALNGLSTIRAYKAYDRMADMNGKSMDNNIRFTLVNMSSNRWLAIRLETLGGLMIWFTATFAVMQNGRAQNQQEYASTMGLLLSYALNLKIEAERIDRPSPISAPKDCTTNAVESKQPPTKPSTEAADSKPPETTETAGSKPPATTETADSKQPATKPSSETPESKKPATKPSTETPESKPPATKPSKETSESKQSATKPSTDTAEPEPNSAKTSTSTESKLYNNFTSITQWRGFFPALKKGVVIPTHSLTPLIPKFTRRKSKRIREDTIPQSSPALDTEAFNFKSSWKNFSLSELQEATDNYSREHLIGQGGYAEVYKGKLKSGKFVAIKKLTRGSPEEMTMDFLSELGIIVHVDHPNIAKMIGYGVEGGMHLVLQLSPHGSLASILYGPKEKLDWRTRFKIAVGTAKGLSYLHEGCQRRIIHKDIKAANILLTEDFDAQISDFGLAKWLPDQWTHHTVSKVEGTFGYLPPEFFMYGIVNEKTDVFAYGVLLLELITGRQAIDSSQQSLIMWAKPLIKENKIKELVDPSLGDGYELDQLNVVLAISSICIHQSAVNRPDMSQVVSILNGDRNSLEGLKEGEHSVLKRTYSEEMDDAEEYNSTKYLSDINRQLEILLDCSKDTL